MVETVRETIGDFEVEDFCVLNAGGLAPHLVSAVQELDRKVEARIQVLAAENEGLRKERSDLKLLVEQHLGLTSAAAGGAIGSP